MAEGWIVSQGSPRKFAVSWKTAMLGLAKVHFHPNRDLLFPETVGLATEAGWPASLAFYEAGSLYYSDHVEVVGGRVTHTHSPAAYPAPQARMEIPCLGTTHADYFFGPVPVTRSLTPEEVAAAYEAHTGHVIVERFADLDPLSMPAVLVAGHAPFVWGRDAADSVENAVALEAVAVLAKATLTLCREAPPLESHVLDKHHQRKHGQDAYYGQHNPNTNPQEPTTKNQELRTDPHPLPTAPFPRSPTRD